MSSRLIAYAGRAWTDALSMRFIREVIDDIIDDAVFARYVQLEQQFVRVACRTLGAAILRAPNEAALRGHLATLNALVQDQLPYFETGGATPQAEVPRDHLLAPSVLRVAESATYSHLVALMLPSELLYLDWCATADRHPSPRANIAEWVHMHTVPPFTDRVAFLRSEVDALHVGNDEFTHLGDLVAEVLRWEVAFHEVSYEAP